MAKTISKMQQRVQAAARHRSNKPVLPEFQRDASGDVPILDSLTESWDDLNTLRETLATSAMEMVVGVTGMTQNPQLMEALGEKRPEFDKLMALLLSDSEQFSQRIMNLRLQHEHRTGRFADLDEYNTYSRLALEYRNATHELEALLAPTISELVLLSHTCVGDRLVEARAQENAAVA